MPEKDGSEDKKSTKSVVNKKQKQFMNQEEQLDLSSVAESFGGQIVGEPVELDEIAVTGTLATAAALKYGIPLAMTAIGGLGTYLQIKKRMRRNKNDQDIGGPTGGTKDRSGVYTPPKEELKKIKKTLNKDVADNTVSNFFNKFRKNKNNNQSNKNNKNKDNKRGVGFGLGLGSGLGTSSIISNLTKTKKKGAGGGFRLGGLPGTAHNVGRTTNPQ